MTTQSTSEAELAKRVFVRKAQSLGFRLRKPDGENLPYDFLLNSGKLTWRIEVKAIQSGDDLDHLDLGHLNLERNGLGRRTRCSGNDDRHCKAHQVDFVAAYEVPLDTWYIIPISREALANRDISA
jgi:hypothetical protein